MIRILGTIFAGLLGLAFGSFLNVCLSRWPQGESIVHPRSHCRNCDHTLSWWENIPLISWLALRGRCRTCHTPISWRYPVVESLVGFLWGLQIWQTLPWVLAPDQLPIQIAFHVFPSLISLVFLWLLIALSVLDAEHLWLPDWLTISGVALGIGNAALYDFLLLRQPHCDCVGSTVTGTLAALLRSLIAAAIVLAIRWLYKLIRHREGIGLGDAKLMALLAAWLGLPGALLAFFIGVLLGALIGVALLIIPKAKPDSKEWSATKLPLGTFICIGGIISALWGQPLIAAYLHWAGF